MINKLLVISSLFVAFFLLPTTNSELITVRAADSTPSADIKLKLEQFRAEIASKAAKLKLEVNRKLQNRAYIGEVKQKSKNSLTIATLSGPKIVSIKQDTILPEKTTVEEDYTASLGDIDETGVLTAKKIILLPTPNSELKTYLWGQIISISDTLVTLKDKNLKSVAVSLPDFAKVKNNDFVILTGNMGKNDIFKAEFVYIIPQGGFLKSKKIATPSAKESTKSAKP